MTFQIFQDYNAQFRNVYTSMRPLNCFGKFGIYSKTFQTFQTSTFQNLEMDKHLKVAVCPFPNFEKFGKLESLESLENMILLLQSF